MIYELTLPEGLRLLGRYTLGCAEQKGWNQNFIGCKIFTASQEILPSLRWKSHVLQQLDTALYMLEIRKKLIDQSNTKAKEASPGTLES